MDVDAGEQAIDIPGKIRKLKKQLALFETIMEDKFVPIVEETKAELLVLQQQQVAARPLPQRLRDVNGKIERKEKAIRKKQDEEVPKLQKILDKAAADLEEANAAIRKLQEELEEARSDQVQLLASHGKDAAEEAKEQSPNEKLEEGFRIINSVLAHEGGTVVQLAQADGTSRADLERMWNGMEKLFRTAVGPTAPGEQGAAKDGDKPSAQEVPVADDLPNATANADGSPFPGKDHDQSEHGDFEQLLDAIMDIADDDERDKRKGELLRAHKGPNKSSRR